MADTTIQKSMIIHKNYTFSNIAVTTRSGNGAYYAGTSNSVVVSGYTPIAVTIVTWTGLAASVSPYLQADGKINFLSDISQTLTSITLKVVYIRSS